MTGFSLVGLTEGDPLLPNKLACTPPSPPSPPHIHISSLLCPKNVDFVIFMQFLAISSNSRHSLPPHKYQPTWKTLNASSHKREAISKICQFCCHSVYYHQKTKERLCFLEKRITN